MGNTKADKAIEAYNKKDYQKAIDLFSSVLETEQSSAELYNNIALCYYNTGDFDKAEKNFLKAQNLNPKLAQVYINLADIYYKKKEYMNGIQLLSQGIYEIPDNLVLRHYLLL